MLVFRTAIAFIIGVVAALALLCIVFELAYLTSGGERGLAVISIVLFASTLAGIIVAAFERGPTKRFIRTFAVGVAAGNIGAAIAIFEFLSSIQV